ncbi:hypothetical protein RND71_030028 [Anisodus tanguticus]|uniref:Uncharacterized protein n=1 Tax=Anisodus tanguticus TaxID=243964 RepID=A0AAE1RFM3_9SOLA|nr:hypothetical protein RND71_030028 [Anisodus tanguticus]
MSQGCFFTRRTYWIVASRTNGACFGRSDLLLNRLIGNNKSKKQDSNRRIDNPDVINKVVEFTYTTNAISTSQIMRTIHVKRYWLRKLGSLVVRHRFREANQVAQQGSQGEAVGQSMFLSNPLSYIMQSLCNDMSDQYVTTNVSTLSYMKLARLGVRPKEKRHERVTYIELRLR